MVPCMNLITHILLNKTEMKVIIGSSHFHLFARIKWEQYVHVKNLKKLNKNLIFALPTLI